MNDRLEKFIEKFERDFADGRSPNIEDFVEESSDDSLLSELVHTELELRLSAGDDVRVENYTQRFPDLLAHDDAFRDLVLTEYKVRRNFDPSCRIEEYLLRFPRLRQVLVDDFLESSVAGDVSHERATDSSLPVRPKSASDVAARFSKKNLFAQGGLGNVWLARDAELGRDVAVKEIKSKFASSGPHRTRFERETRITGRLEHPGIVPVYGKGQTGNGAPFFAMQFVRGDNLKSRIESLHREHTPQQLRQTKDFNRLLQHFVDICQTVEFAHSQGVIHRDIKPENIMIGSYGETFLIDWGLACSEDDREAVQRHTRVEVHDQNLSRVGQAIGSPAFMSPEQTRGEKANVASDVYSLGATLFSLLKNATNPNDAISEKTGGFDKIRKRCPRELAPLLSVCQRAMHPSCQERYPSVQALREDVENFVLDNRVVAHQDSVFEKWSRFTRRNRRVLNTVLVALLLISLLSAVSAIWINAERNEAIIARQSETDLRRQAQRSQRLEQAARDRAEQRTGQLTHVIGIFADALTGSDDAGLFNNPADLTADEIIEDLHGKIDDQDQPIVQALLRAVVARGRRVAGKSDEAINHYKDTIALLDQEEIAFDDPLRIDVMTGLCAAKMAAGKLTEANELALKIVDACQASSVRSRQNLFRITLIQAQLAARNQRYQLALALAQEANEIGDQLFSEQSHSNYMWAKYVLAGIHRRLGKTTVAKELFNLIVENQDFAKRNHPLSIAATVQLSEIEFKDKPEAAAELMQQAYEQAKEVYGKDHPDTFKVQARLGRMLARHNEPKQRKQGIELLAHCRQQQIESSGAVSDDVLGTTLLLAEALIETDDQPFVDQCIQVLNESIDALENSSQPGDRAAAFTAAFYDKLAIAYQKLDQTDEALEASNQAVAWAEKAYGSTSEITIRLTDKRDKLRGQE